MLPAHLPLAQLFLRHGRTTLSCGDELTIRRAMALPSRRAPASWVEHLRETSPLFGSGSGKGSRMTLPRILPWVLVVALAGALLLQQRVLPDAGTAPDVPADQMLMAPPSGKFFVSYSYFEKDDVQVRLDVRVLLAAAPAGWQQLHLP